MPAARVDFKIAPNTNPLTDIGGAGALEKADKTEVYSRDGNGSDHRAQPVRAVLRAVRPGDGRRSRLLPVPTGSIRTTSA